MADEKLKLIIKTEPKALFVSPIDEDIIYYHTTSRVSNKKEKKETKIEWKVVGKEVKLTTIIDESAKDLFKATDKENQFKISLLSSASRRKKTFFQITIKMINNKEKEEKIIGKKKKIIALEYYMKVELDNKIESKPIQSNDLENIHSIDLDPLPFPLLDNSNIVIEISLLKEQPIASPSPNRPIKIEKIEENERNTSDDIFNLSNISKELDDSDLLRELLEGEIGEELFTNEERTEKLRSLEKDDLIKVLDTCFLLIRSFCPQSFDIVDEKIDQLANNNNNNNLINIPDENNPQKDKEEEGEEYDSTSFGNVEELLKEVVGTAAD